MLGAKTAVAVQRAIEPVTEDREAAVSRRWIDYKNGRHKPVASVIDLADLQIPTTKAFFGFLLWDALRLEKSERLVARKLFGTTASEGDALLQWMLSRPRIRHDDRWLRKRCRAVVADGSLEGLAILTVCMRLAGRTEAPRLALTFYGHATDCLMMLGGWFYVHGIAQTIAEYYEKMLLPACCSEHKLGSFSSEHYLRSVKVLAKVVLVAQEKAGRELTHAEVISAMRQVFDK